MPAAVPTVRKPDNRLYGKLAADTWRVLFCYSSHLLPYEAVLSLGSSTARGSSVPNRRDGTVPTAALTQIFPADLDIPVFGQLPSAQAPLRDAFEAGPLEILRGRPSRQPRPAEW